VTRTQTLELNHIEPGDRRFNYRHEPTDEYLYHDEFWLDNQRHALGDVCYFVVREKVDFTVDSWRQATQCSDTSCHFCYFAGIVRNVPHPLYPSKLPITFGQEIFYSKPAHDIRFKDLLRDGMRYVYRTFKQHFAHPDPTSPHLERHFRDARLLVKASNHDSNEEEELIEVNFHLEVFR
jgi:hypothetical protein